MKSYALAVAAGMIIAALYAVQNGDIITVNFLVWQRDVHQGIWEVLVFAAGALLMWVASVGAIVELKGRSKSRVKELERQISALEKEKASFIETLQGGHKEE
ncbi:MAG: lipopolysaccharide assembly protein [Synergistaceae bacterium]|nr:lipopolysaccharide assembly protein [Synergistaceae bacterium]MDI3532883.1 lipopolysaccharide assembly protein [Synergistaceae bacterium]